MSIRLVKNPFDDDVFCYHVYEGDKLKVVKSIHSINEYGFFYVNVIRKTVSFTQIDNRRRDVARFFEIKFKEDLGEVKVLSITALSANGKRKETFSKTQCLELAKEMYIKGKEKVIKELS